MVVQTAAAGGLLGVATDFALKNGFGFVPGASARYGAIVGLPAYFAFLFGDARDRWSWRLGGDRTLMMAEAAVSVLAFGLLASVETAYLPFLSTMLAVGFASQFSGAAKSGARALFAKSRGVTDRVSGFNLGLETMIASGMGLAAGWGAFHLGFRTLLALSAAFGVVYLALLAFAPKGAFLPPVPPERKGSSTPLAARFAVLVASRPYVAALGFTFAFAFSPLSSPGFFYYSTDVLGVDAQLMGIRNALFNLAPLPVALLYGAYARRTGLRNRLAIAMVSLLFGVLLTFALRSRADFLPYAALVGASNAMYFAASNDLLLGSVPKGSEGLGFALQTTCNMLLMQGSSLLGAWVFSTYGYTACIWLSLPAPLLGLSFLALVPRAQPNSQPSPSA